MSANPTAPIMFYDIIMRPPVEENACSPNPWKSRYALNFKHLPYTTTWVHLPDIANVRKSLGVPACRKFADGTDFYTLPIIVDPSTDAKVGDSLEIAIYLQETYPDTGDGDLFPEQKLDFTVGQEFSLLIPLTAIPEGCPYPEYARFNAHVDAAFTAHVGLGVAGMPFHPESEEASRAEFVHRAGVQKFEDFIVEGEARTKLKESFRTTLRGLADLFQRDTSGPFLMGKKMSYADIIVGAWLKMLSVTLSKDEWEELRGWHSGVFAQLHDSLQKYAEVK